MIGIRQVADVAQDQGLIGCQDVCAAGVADFLQAGADFGCRVEFDFRSGNAMPPAGDLHENRVVNQAVEEIACTTTAGRVTAIHGAAR